EFADIDLDGDLDIVVGNDNAPNYLYINDGTGMFTRGETFGLRYAPTRNITIVDLNKDGYPDIVINNRGKQNEICINDGTGKFLKSKLFGGNADATIDVEGKDMDG